ncbi:MAG: hypothetical protein H8K04_05595 [Nitrospira sp.]
MQLARKQRVSTECVQQLLTLLFCTTCVAALQAQGVVVGSEKRDAAGVWERDGPATWSGGRVDTFLNSSSDSIGHTPPWDAICLHDSAQRRHISAHCFTI